MSSMRLRPLGVGEILDASIKLYARNARTLIGAAAVAVIPLQLISAVVLLSVYSSGQDIEDEAAGHCDVEAGAAADHRDLDARVGGLDVLGGDTLGLMAEQDHRWLCGGAEARERDRVLGQLDGEDPPAPVALMSDPAVLAGVDPVDAAALSHTA